jgi:Protein of unknown function (DUF3570)
MTSDNRRMNSGRAYILAACLLLLPLRKSHAEDRADFKFSYYLEDHGRTEAFSPALLIETDLTPNTILTIQSVYDVISGATPTGEPMKRKTREVVVDVPTAQTSYVAVSGASGRGTTLVPVTTSATTTQTTLEEYGKPYLPMADYEDQRWALNLGLRHRHGEWVVDAGMAYSTESDYHSLTESLIVSRDFNERMTTVSVGASLTQDNVLDTPTGDWLDKDTFEGQVQLAQVIDPFTLLKVSFVAGTSWGYLDDQYKFVLLNDELIDEKRPDSRDKQIIYTSLNRYIEPLNGALEASYRFYTDTYGIDAHTFGLDWFQNLGPKLILVPGVRYYEQSAADFYATKFTGSPKDYSSDYRLSKLGSVTYGMKLIWKVNDRFWADLAYERYSQFGRDKETPGEAYPEANVVTLGFKVWF